MALIVHQEKNGSKVVKEFYVGVKKNIQLLLRNF